MAVHQTYVRMQSNLGRVLCYVGAISVGPVDLPLCAKSEPRRGDMVCLSERSSQAPPEDANGRQLAPDGRSMPDVHPHGEARERLLTLPTILGLMLPGNGSPEDPNRRTPRWPALLVLAVLAVCV